MVVGPVGESVNKSIIFRADASLQIGTGHVMRCLTLADALKAQGATCEFICREHPGNLIAYIQSKGYDAHSLSMGKTADTDLTHSKWLGSTQAQDAEACAPILNKLQPDWLAVDHYALDTRWETKLAPYYQKLMVIDDLADRVHQCDVLLDQTYGRDEYDYVELVPNSCSLLCGSNYALLRPEFAELRAYSLQRRPQPQLRRLLVTMGGVDKGNVTNRVLNCLRSCHLPPDCEINVVVGSSSPNLAKIQSTSKTMPWLTKIHVGVNNMAELMAESDLAIGAAGATSWERCCLGLPTTMIVLAENQQKIAQELFKAGAAIELNIDRQEDCVELISKALQTNFLSEISQLASQITDGLGCQRVTAVMNYET